MIYGIRCYAPISHQELVDYAFANKSILIALNAEKILKAPSELRNLINKNIGYSDGIGAVWALKKKGVDNVLRIPGVELWLEIIKEHHKDKTFY